MKIETKHKNLWNAGKAVLTGEFIALNAYIQKKALKHLEKEQ